MTENAFDPIRPWRGIAAGALLLQLLGACSPARPANETPTDLTTLSQSHATTVAATAPDSRLIIGRGEDYQPFNEPPDQLFTVMRDSIKQRRERAWQIVENIIRPTTLAAGEGQLKLPIWQTWYENDPEVVEMMAEYFRKLKATPGADRERLIEEVFQEYTERDLAVRLTDAAFRQRLKQFEGSPELTAGLNGRGSTLFSPSFVRHIMLQAQGAENCPFNVPPHSRPEDLGTPGSATNFSSCIVEFPRSAVMVKTTWMPIDTQLPDPDTSEATMRTMIRTGTWPVPPNVTPGPNAVYTLTSSSGERMALTGLHLVTKDVREWVWVTLWWDPQPNGDFGSDRPASIARYNNGVWSNYKMCATASFEEGDAEPWSHFSDPSFQGALRGVHSELDGLIARTAKSWPAEWKAVPRLAGTTPSASPLKRVRTSSGSSTSSRPPAGHWPTEPKCPRWTRFSRSVIRCRSWTSSLG